MTVKLFLAGVVVSLSVHCLAADTGIRVAGVMESDKGPAAVINGRLCRVNDKIGSGTVTAIDLNGVTITENGKQTVHKVGNSGGSTKAGSVQEKKTTGMAAWWNNLTKKKKKRQSAPPSKCAEVRAPKQQAKPKASSSCGGTSSVLENKMKRAENLLLKEKAEFDQFRTRTLSRCKSQSDLERAISEYNTMLRVNLNKIRHLELPCSGPAEYTRWLSSYQSRLNAMRESNLSEVDATIRRAGYTAGQINLSGTDLLRGK